MQSEILTFPRENGEIQRVHLVRPEEWAALDFLKPAPSEQAFECFYKIYHLYLVPSAPEKFGTIVMFRLPGDPALPDELRERYGDTVSDPLTMATLALCRGVDASGEEIAFREEWLKAFWQELQEHNCIRIVRGKLPVTKIIPVGDAAGFLSEAEGKLKVNSSFFIMDPFDCATPYDHVGTPFGLLVKNGSVENPPLFHREALLVYADGRVRIEHPDLKKLRIRIGNEVFVHGENAVIDSRPDCSVSSHSGMGLVIIGRRVAAVGEGEISVPASGFVLRPMGACSAKPGDQVTYEGMEKICFGIQVGNSIVRDGVKTRKFISRFYDVQEEGAVAFPPSLYPLDFEHARAARIAIGADEEGKPMLLWAEGAAKLGHIPGIDSCGASLSEMAEICEAVGMKNAVNLDGGGSAQILADGQRRLWISDRSKEDFSESERPVPMGLIIR